MSPIPITIFPGAKKVHFISIFDCSRFWVDLIYKQTNKYET